MSRLHYCIYAPTRMLGCGRQIRPGCITHSNSMRDEFTNNTHRYMGSMCNYDFMSKARDAYCTATQSLILQLLYLFYLQYYGTDEENRIQNTGCCKLHVLVSHSSVLLLLVHGTPQRARSRRVYSTVHTSPPLSTIALRHHFG